MQSTLMQVTHYAVMYALCILACHLIVMDVYNDKVVDTSYDTTTDTVSYNENEAIGIPVIEDITKDDNFVNVSYLWCVCVCIN